MSILTYPLGFIGGGKEFYNGVIENSLRINAGDDGAMQRTPTTDGSGDRATFSFWFKFHQGSTTLQHIITSDTGSNPDRIIIGATNGTDGVSLQVSFDLRSGAYVHTSGVLRDPSAWYHGVVEIDATNSAESPSDATSNKVEEKVAEAPETVKQS